MCSLPWREGGQGGRGREGGGREEKGKREGWEVGKREGQNEGGREGGRKTHIHISKVWSDIFCT